MEQLYQQKLMDHYRNPSNRGIIENPSFRYRVYNPLCGDMVEVMGIVTGKQLTTVRFQGSGCVISQAVASLLYQAVQGKTLLEIMRLSPEEAIELVGVELGLVRLKCALLAWEALQLGILGMGQ